MRFAATLVVCVGLSLTAAGCDPQTDRQYMREGVGVDLNSSKLPQATDRQEQYIDYICQQAGYSYSDAIGRTSSCIDKSGWTAFVQAGMNDIDQRCDAYLSWLDAKRRDREPVLRQLAAVSGATHSIMTVSGAGTDSLDIVSTALSLAAASYANWNSRLLLEVDQSTVMTLVYSRQVDFRNAIAKEFVPDRPRAIYLLRNYVRICLPITIETDINTSITLVQRGNPADVKKNPVAKTAGTVPIELNVTTPIPPSKQLANILHPAQDSVEDTLPFPIGKAIQKALCVKKPNGDFGNTGSETRSNLRDFKAGLLLQKSDELKGLIENASDRADVIKATELFPSCHAAGFVTAYEVGAFTRHTAPGIRKMLITGLKAVVEDAATAPADKTKTEALKAKLEALNQPKIQVMNLDVSDAIRILSKRYGLAEASRIDFAFLQQLELKTAK